VVETRTVHSPERSLRELPNRLRILPEKILQYLRQQDVNQEVAHTPRLAALGGGDGRGRHRDAVAEQDLLMLRFVIQLHVRLEAQCDVLVACV